MLNPMSSDKIVYLIGFEHKEVLYLKIGVSNNINKRIKEL